jgi:hypothetical protein
MEKFIKLRSGDWNMRKILLLLIISILIGTVNASENLLTNPSFEDWSSGPNSPPDGWVVFGVDEEIEQNFINVYSGDYSALILAGPEYGCQMYQEIANCEQYKGSTVTFGAWVWTNTINTGRIYINDGVSITQSSYHTGGSEWEYLTVTKTIDENAEEITCALKILSASRYSYFDDCLLFAYPSSPTNLTSDTDNLWINYTWDIGSNTDSFNVSQNSTWYNGTTNLFFNSSIAAHSWSNISVYGYNSSFDTLSSPISDTVQLSNNPITITGLSNINQNEGTLVSIDAGYFDLDDDTPIFSCNRTDLFTDFSSATGAGSWQTDFTDDGVYYVDFGVSDGYGSIDNQTVTITINDYGTPTAPTNLNSNTGNFWVNWSWNVGENTDSFNVSHNSVWYNGTVDEYFNASLSAHASSDISVYGYNSTSGLLSSFVSDSTQLTNNPITISDVSSSYSLNEGETLNIDAGYSDLDGDTGTFTDNSTEWDVNSVTGVVSWVTTDGDQGVYDWQIEVSDGYGSTDTEIFTVTVIDSTPTMTTLANTTGNFYINWTWDAGDNVDDYDVWIDGIDQGADITDLFFNQSSSAHDSITISVRSHNHTLGSYSSWVNDSMTIPNNPIAISDISSSYIINVNDGETLSIDAGYSDIDGDTGTFADNSSVWDVNTSTGVVSWTPGAEDEGVYDWYMNVSDGYCSTDTQEFSVAVTYDYENFTFSDASVSKTQVYEMQTSYIEINITDYDGTIEEAIVNVDGTNYSMELNDELWEYPYFSNVLTVHRILYFYAKDNEGYWNSTPSNLTIAVVSASGGGGGGGGGGGAPSVTYTNETVIGDLKLDPPRLDTYFFYTKFNGEQTSTYKFESNREIISCKMTPNNIATCEIIDDNVIRVTINVNESTDSYTGKLMVVDKDDFIATSDIILRIVKITSSMEISPIEAGKTKGILGTFFNFEGTKIVGIRYWFLLALGGCFCIFSYKSFGKGVK